MKSFAITPKTKKILIGVSLVIILVVIITVIAVLLSKKTTHSTTTSPTTKSSRSTTTAAGTTQPTVETTQPVVEDANIYYGKITGGEEQCLNVGDVGKVDISRLLMQPEYNMVAGKPTIDLMFADKYKLTVYLIGLIFESKFSNPYMIVRISDKSDNIDTLNLIEGGSNEFGQVMKINKHKLYRVDFVNSGAIRSGSEYILDGYLRLIPIKSMDLSNEPTGKICYYTGDEMLSGPNILSLKSQIEFIFNLETLYDYKMFPTR